MKRITLILAVFLLSCNKEEDKLPQPVQNTTISSKIVRMDVENNNPVVTIITSSNGLKLSESLSDKWYEYELNEGDTFKLETYSSTGLGNPTIDVYVDGVLTHTETGAINSNLSYTYKNNQ